MPGKPVACVAVEPMVTENAFIVDVEPIAVEACEVGVVAVLLEADVANLSEKVNHQ